MEAIGVEMSNLKLYISGIGQDVPYLALKVSLRQLLDKKCH